ncbi:M50 family metallopeptidase [Salipaludibacillus keqinensis]|uniref:M50 family metallopeptidase n=1 Tax=Salipaludibacillus keqinensis TaxID=2045207 RepID=UPI0011AEFC8B|nr:M50 family metallopeptidase [Salipaludibacillus keqinensis]
MKKIKIHPILWAIFAVGALTGLFKEILMLFVIILVHEMGHVLMAYKFGWRIRRILLLPFGGIAEMDEYGNRPAKEEILVTLSGPVQHVWMIGVSFLLLNSPFWSEGDHKLFLFHNVTILLFNFLPVFPLDGGKLFFSLQTLFLPFQRSYHLSFTVSFMVLLCLTYGSLFLLPFHLNLVLILFFLWIHQYLEWKQRHYHFLRFILERKRMRRKKRRKYLKVLPSLTVSQAIRSIYREKELTFICSNDAEIPERILLDAFFERNYKDVPLSQLMK